MKGGVFLVSCETFVAQQLEDSDFKTQVEVHFFFRNLRHACDGHKPREHNPMTGNERKVRNGEGKLYRGYVVSINSRYFGDRLINPIPYGLEYTHLIRIPY